MPNEDVKRRHDDNDDEGFAKLRALLLGCTLDTQNVVDVKLCM